MKKPLIIASVIVVAVIALVAVLIGVFFSSSDKMVCKSDDANITLLYNNNDLVGYTASGLSYDLDSQKEYAEEVGIDAYLTEFETWFEINTGGICTRKE